MPVVDVELVCESEVELGTVSARAIADAVGGVFPAARPHVGATALLTAALREGDVAVSNMELPVFVTVLHARPPAAAALVAEIAALTTTVARIIGRPAERVHVQYAPAAAGRQAAGGHLFNNRSTGRAI